MRAAPGVAPTPALWLTAPMADEHLQYGTRVFPLASAGGETCAEVVPELGGIVSSLQLPAPGGASRECLFQYPWFWDRGTEELRGGIPPLFPVCGRLLQDGVRGQYRVGDRPYVLPIHGFAMRHPWKVVDASRPDALRLRLTDNAATRAMYPFAFELELLYVATAAGFTSRLTVRNTGPAPMPYYAGFHPYFLTPPPGAGKEQTRFDARPLARHLYNPTKTDLVATAPLPALPMSVADVDVNELLLETGDRGETRLLWPDGFVLRQIASPPLRFRQFYTLPDHPFFCDEPWMAPPGTLHHPEAVPVLPPGASTACEVLLAAARA